jgi:adenosylcobinamide-GDP ribazoletransferase
MKRFLIAFQFLTIFPIKVKEIKAQEFGKSLRYFPLVGTVIGLILTLSLYIFSLILPHIIVSFLILIILVVITGGIHLDGFADTCDGLCSSHPKDKVLEIMRDSRIGVMGAIGLILLLMLKFSLFYSIPTSVLGKTLVIMVTSGRWLQVLACYLSRYVQDEGKGRYFIEYAGKRELIQSSVFSLIVAMLVMGSKGVAFLILLTIIVLPIISYIKKRLGGMTGDTIGAVSEISEVIILFMILIWEMLK